MPGHSHHKQQQETKMLDVENSDLVTWAMVPFRGNASMIAAMRHPQYRINAEYREAVEAKVAGMTSNTFQATTYRGVEREITETSAPESAQVIQDAAMQAAQKALVESHGASAVR